MLLALSLLLSPASAATLTVCESGCAYTTPAAAAGAAVNGDVIELARTRHVGPSLVARTDITVRPAPEGEGRPVLVLEGKAAGVVHALSGHLTLEGITVEGNGGRGSVLVPKDGMFTGIDVEITGADGGYATVMVMGGTAEFSDCHIHDNRSNGSVVTAAAGQLRMRDCVIENNQAQGTSQSPEAAGGVTVHSAEVKLKRTTIRNNTGVTGGAVVQGEQGVLTLGKSTVTGNHGTGGAGGVHVSVDAGTANVWNESVVSGNTSDAASSGDARWPDCHGVDVGCES